LYFYHFYHGPVPVVVLGFDFYEFSEGVLNWLFMNWLWNMEYGLRALCLDQRISARKLQEDKFLVWWKEGRNKFGFKLLVRKICQEYWPIVPHGAYIAPEIESRRQLYHMPELYRWGHLRYRLFAKST
jgi:hypothetical protein